MERKLTRRNVLGAAGTLALVGSPALVAAQATKDNPKAKPLTILGISCSPRKGKTTATALQAVLDAAKEVDSRIKVQLIDLGGLEISGWKPTGGKQDNDAFNSILPKLQGPDVAGLIIGSPVYFRCRSVSQRRSGTGNRADTSRPALPRSNDCRRQTRSTPGRDSLELRQ
ncbi:MAG: flavodoxin family protein [Planctomycetota bacterium]|jgi:hypothetical protein